MIQEQTYLILDILCQKLEKKLDAAELYVKAKQIAIDEEVKLQQKLILKKLEA